VNNSAADCSISLKVYAGFGHVRPEIPQKFKVKRSKVKVTARRNASKNLPNGEQLSRDCSISIKFCIDCDHVPPDLPQTFKVNGLKGKVIA